MKKQSFYYCAFFLAINGIRCQETIYETESFDDLANSLDETTIARQFDPDCLPTQQIVEDLVRIGAPAALQRDIYCATYPPVIRDVLRLPATQIYFDRNCDTAFGFNFFFNHTPRVYFTAHSPFIKCYLDIEDPDFLEELDLDLLTTIDIPEVIPLFKDLKLQEWRCGFMFGAHKKYKSAAFTAMLPFYWALHNFFLTPQERARIKNAPLFAEAGAGNDEDGETAFAYKHLVATSFGFGDLLLRAEYYAVQTPHSELKVGLQFISPTAHAFNGCRSRLWFGDILLFGGCYCKKCPPPPFDFAEIFRLALCCPEETAKICQQQAIDMGVNFAVGALDRLTANLADRSLGQEHFSLGPTFEYTHDLSHGVSFVGKGIIEYFFPRNETRFFLVLVNPLEFARNYTDESQAEANIAFLNEQFKNTLYPAPACVRVHPGASIEFSAAFAYDRDNFHAEMGYDLWFQGKENISVKCCKQNLDIRKGIKPWARQSKVFGKAIGYCNDWHVGLQADGTIGSRGIGKDFTIAIEYVMDF